MPKSFYEIKALKENWKGDPIWDIEDTEGFEEHRQELLTYRLGMEASWTKQNEERLQKCAVELGCSVNLVRHIEILEYRLEKLEEKTDHVS